MTLVNKTDLARNLEVTPQAVHAAIKNGRISYFQKTKLFDLDAATDAFFNNRDASKDRRTKKEKPAPVKKINKIKTILQNVGNACLSPELQAAIDSGSATYAEAKQIREILAAKLEEIEFLQAKRVLIERATVENEWREVAENVKNMLLGFQSKLTDKLATVSDTDVLKKRAKISETIAKEVADILQALSEKA